MMAEGERLRKAGQDNGMVRSMADGNSSGAAKAVSSRTRARQAIAAKMAAQRAREEALERGYTAAFSASDAVAAASAKLTAAQAELAVKLRALTELGESAEDIAGSLGLEVKEVRRLLAGATTAAAARAEEPGVEAQADPVPAVVGGE